MNRYGALRQALVLVGDDPAPRLTALYNDTRRAWLTSRSAAHDLHELLMVMLHERDEVSVEDEAQIRMAYEIRRVA